MARKIKSLSIDGIHVDESRARFSDTFDVAERDERLLACDEEVVYVVIARVGAPTFRTNKKTGEIYRVNVLNVKEARLITDEDAKNELLDEVKFDYRPQPSLFDDGGEDVDESDVDDTPPVRFPVPDPAEAELDFQGVGMQEDRLEDEPLLADPPFEDVGTLEEFEAEFEPDEEEDAEFQKQMARLKAVADEFDEADLYEPPNEPVLVETSSNGHKRYRPPQTSDEDPVLAKFLGD